MKITEIEEIMKLMTKYKVTAIKCGDTEIVMPPVYEAAEIDEPELDDDELMFYSNGE